MHQGTPPSINKSVLLIINQTVANPNDKIGMGKPNIVNPKQNEWMNSTIPATYFKPNRMRRDIFEKSITL